jgi:hypothetical protein
MQNFYEYLKTRFYLVEQHFNVSMMSVIKKKEFLVLIGFLITFFVWVIGYSFLNSINLFQTWNQLPRIIPIGDDLRAIIGSSRQFWNEGYDKDIPVILPMFHYLLYPLISLKHSDSYKIIISIIYISAMVLPITLLQFSKKKNRDYTLLFVFFIINLFSYGFQFEMERGQTNFIVTTLLVISIYIYKKFPQRIIIVILSFLIFSICVNLKLWPLIFVVCFIDFPFSAKKAARNSILLIVFILLPFYARSYDELIYFVHRLISYSEAPMIWMGNVSAFGFWGLVRASSEGNSIVHVQNATYASILIYLLLLFSHLYFVVKWEKSLTNGYTLLLLLIGAIIIPSTSHDYKLCLLAPFVGLFFHDYEIKVKNKINILFQYLFGLFISLSFFHTTYSIYIRGTWANQIENILIQNSFIAISILFISVYFIFVLNEKPLSLHDNSHSGLKESG